MEFGFLIHALLRLGAKLGIDGGIGDCARVPCDGGTTPLGRGPGLDEICRTLRLILAAPAMTGQMIALDGGRHLGWLVPQDPSAS
jgi:hypothetical protein